MPLPLRWQDFATADSLLLERRYEGDRAVDHEMPLTIERDDMVAVLEHDQLNGTCEPALDDKRVVQTRHVVIARM